MEFLSASASASNGKEEDEDEEEQPPVISRGISSTLASICAVDRARAREALTQAGGDVDQAALMLMSSSGCGVGVTPAQELSELGGLTLEQAEEHLIAAGGDEEQAKANVLAAMGISTAPEQYSCLLHPEVLSVCPVCCDTPETCSGLVQLQQCDHLFCVDCLQGWITSEAGSSSTGRIQCPQQGCGCAVSHAELKELLALAHEEELFRQIDRRALELLTASEPSLHLCPSPDCTYIVSWDAAEPGATPCITCPLCDVQRCLACGTSPYHVDQSCAQHLHSKRLEREQQQREQQQGGGGAGGAGGAGGGESKQQQEQQEEEATLLFLQQSGMRVCKQCKGGVVKSGGCDKMKCRCGYRFCYQCDAENARCDCTPRMHGFWDNIKGGGDFANLR